VGPRARRVPRGGDLIADQAPDVTDEARRAVRGATDLYTHASPDLLPRRGDDLQLAREAKDAGYAAAVHRHHFSATAERARLASDATGFRLLGAILLNDSAGGFNRDAVDLALRMGAVWVSLPTVNARWYRSRLARLSPERQKSVAFGRGDLSALDAGGKLLPAVDEILPLVAEKNAALNLGYVSYAEMKAVSEAAARHGIGKVVLTSPLTSGGLTQEQADTLMEREMTTIELTAYSMYPGRVGGADLAVADAARLIRHVGVGRCVLSSDGGSAGSPPPAEILAWGCARLAEQGFTQAELTALVRTNPARLVA
jgi:hypothetical protein